VLIVKLEILKAHFSIIKTGFKKTRRMIFAPAMIMDRRSTRKYSTYFMTMHFGLNGGNISEMYARAK